MSTATTRRTGDTIEIPGGYQFDALESGNAVQRFWHHNKKLVVEQFLKPQADDFVLDVGCGSGVISAVLAENAGRVIGVDGNADAIRFARQQFNAPNLAFQEGLVDENFDPGAPVDKIYCLEVIEHIYFDQGRAMLENFYNMLKPGGAVFLTTPNYRSFWPVIEWLMDRLRLAPQMADHQHVALYHGRLLRELAANTGFEVETIAMTSFAAPWLAPLSWNLALRTHDIETGSPLPGSILVAVFRKSEQAAN